MSNLDGLVVDLFLAFVEDDDILLVEVWYIEFSEVNKTIEGESKSLLVQNQLLCLSTLCDLLLEYLLISTLSNWSDGDEERKWHTSFLTLGEYKTLWESTGVDLLIDEEFVFAFNSAQDLLVQLSHGCEILRVSLAVLEVTLDGVAADLDLRVESVNLYHVLAFLVNIENTSFTVVFWSKEDTDNDISNLVRFNIDLEVEWFVVETVLTGNDLHVFVILDFVDESGGSDINVVLFKVGDELVNFDGLDSYTWVGELLTSVRWEVGLVSEVQFVDAVDEVVEEWITKSSGVVFECTIGDIVLVSDIVDVSKDSERKLVYSSVEAWVDRVSCSLDEVAKDFDTIFVVEIYFLSILCVDKSEINSVKDSAFESLNKFSFVGAGLGWDDVVWSGWNFLTVGVLKVWCVSIDDWFVPLEDIDFLKIVGETFELVTGQELLMSIVESFSTTVLTTDLVLVLVLVLLLSYECSIVNVEEVVPLVDSNIFSEIRETSFRVDFPEVVASIFVKSVGALLLWLQLLLVVVDIFVQVLWVQVRAVDLDNKELVLWQLFLIGKLHAETVSLLDDSVVDEEMGVDLVCWGEDKSLCVLTVEKSNVKSINKDSRVEVNTGPCSSLVEGFQVLGSYENVVKLDGFL